MNRLLIGVLAGLLVGITLGFAGTFLFTNPFLPELASDEREPLYWVAPMDPNYRRDQPGKSPMGMDLIPVYDKSGSAEAEPGIVKISPEVVNNLGVRTAPVELRALQSTIRTVGYVQYDQDRLVHLHPRVEGWVEKLYVKAAGDPVTKSEPVYELYSPQLVNAQEEFVLAMNHNDRKLLRSAKERLLALQIAPSFIRHLERTKQVKQTVTFYAPQGGFIDNLNIREGFYVVPGTTLLSIASLDDVWVEAEIFERQASMVSVGQAVTMTLEYLPGEKWIGKVDYIYPTLNEQNRTLRLRLRFANPQQLLKPNMFAQVVIHSDNREERLVVPNEALIRMGTQDRVVLALGEGRFKSIAVESGQNDDNFTVILNGLAEAEDVVTSAQFLLDSESSKSSDFKRMHHPEAKPVSVWVEATVEEVMADMGMLKVTHQPIDVWGWPVMTMMFPVDVEMNLETLRTGMLIHIEITQTGDTDWVLSQIHIENTPVEMPKPPPTKSGSLDHSEMDHFTHKNVTDESGDL